LARRQRADTAGLWILEAPESDKLVDLNLAENELHLNFRRQKRLPDSLTVCGIFLHRGELGEKMFFLHVGA
jgi:hypothetical protein